MDGAKVVVLGEKVLDCRSVLFAELIVKKLFDDGGLADAAAAQHHYSHVQRGFFTHRNFGTSQMSLFSSKIRNNTKKK